MNIADWVKQNKAAAAGIGGLGLLLVMSKGHSSSSVSSSDGTADGAPADGQHVQLIPVSSGPSESVDPTMGETLPDTPPNNNMLGDTQLPAGGVNVGGDLNSPIVDNTPAASGVTAEQVGAMIAAAIPQTGPTQSGHIAAAVATKATTHPPGHPAYKTVVQASPAHGGRQDAYHVYTDAHGKVTRKVDVGPAATHAPPKPAPKPPPPPPRRPAPAPVKRAPARRR